MAADRTDAMAPSVSRPVALLLAAMLSLGLLAASDPAAAQTPVGAETAAQPKIDQFVQLLADPGVRDWLLKQGEAARGAGERPAVEPGQAETMRQTMVSSSLHRIRLHLARIATALPNLPARLRQAGDMLRAELEGRSLLGIMAIVAVFIGAGVALAYGAFKLARPLRLWTIAQPRDTPRGRVKKLGGRALFAAIMVGAFVLGSAGTFLAFDWPLRLREVVLAYLSAAIVVWTVRMVAGFALLPPHFKVEHAAEVRALPMDDAGAAHWYRWSIVISAAFMFVWATFTLLPTLGFGRDDILALAVPADIGFLALLVAAIWTRPAREADGSGRLGRTASSWLLTVWLVALFVLRTSGAYTLFWLTLAAVALPAIVLVVQRAVRFVLRPPEPGSEGAAVAPVTLAVIDRGIRVALIAAGAWLLVQAVGLDMSAMDTGHPTTGAILRGVVNALVIVLAADFGWSIVKALIERKLGITAAAVALHGHNDEARMLDPQQARILTLLPIIQNIIFATILIMAVLMILASIGIQIGPLIAGAGVVGVAVGFGAQTVVKDVISGIFYLLDDAFRVGEYISSGKYMGTVESFSLRSIKLRHHRGALYTIPFGELGAVQNQSRDWVTDKFNVTVGHDTDVEAARKLIKKIGQELAADPEFAPWVIEPIKMQGVQEFTDYGIVLRMKMTRRPGGAFAMRRKFLVRVQQAFRERGIRLSMPTVQVQGGGAGPEAAAVAQALAQERREHAAAAAAGG